MKLCINRESKSLKLTIQLYSCHNINMKLLVVVTPPSIYHKANIDGEKLCNEKIQQAVIDLRAELNLEHERNINNISCDNEQSKEQELCMTRLD